MSKISVIIPSYNSEKTIALCLNSALNQSYKKPYEIIVVDSSDDGTDQIIKRMFPEVKLIHLNKKTLPGPARNVGTRATNSDYIAFTDSDCIIDYFWIESILHRIQNSSFDAVGGIILNGTPDSISGTLGYLNEFSLYLPGSKPGIVSGIATANVCYKKKVFDKQQFFQSHFAGEDTVFHWSIIDKGGKLFFDSAIKVTHINRKGFINNLKHQRRIGEGAGIARVIKKRDMILVRNPFLCILVLPWVRLLRIYRRIFLTDKNLWKKTILFFPLSMIIAYSWSLGFLHSILNYRRLICCHTLEQKWKIDDIDKVEEW